MLRTSLRFTSLCAGLMISASALALSLSDLSQGDANGGLKDALTQGAQIAVKQLGTPGGFSNNPDVRIELPGNLGKVAKDEAVRHGRTGRAVGNQHEQGR